MGKLHRSWVVLALLVPLCSLQAADIYRWVDDQGRTHLSDVVPDRYRDSATRTDSRRYELTPEQQHEANERAAQERLRDAPVNPAASASPAAPTPTAATPAPLLKRPAERVSATTSCTTWWRLYRESQECFGPFRTVGGGVKPEAFDHCNEIQSPETRCGPYRD
jgi:hypothetical protein